MRNYFKTFPIGALLLLLGLGAQAQVPIRMADQSPERQQYLLSHPDQYRVKPDGTVEVLAKSDAASKVATTPAASQTKPATYAPAQPDAHVYDLSSLPAEKQAYVRSHPSEFQSLPNGKVEQKVVGAAQPTPVASTPLPSKTEPTTKMVVEPSALQNMDAAKRDYVRSHPELYEIKTTTDNR